MQATSRRLWTWRCLLKENACQLAFLSFSHFWDRFVYIFLSVSTCFKYHAIAKTCCIVRWLLTLLNFWDDISSMLKHIYKCKQSILPIEWPGSQKGLNKTKSCVIREGYINSNNPPRFSRTEDAAGMRRETSSCSKKDVQLLTAELSSSHLSHSPMPSLSFLCPSDWTTSGPS